MGVVDILCGCCGLVDILCGCCGLVGHNPVVWLG